MEPDVRYCTTADGIRIAYTVTGDGPPFVSMIDGIVSHVALEWSHPGAKRMLEAEARYFTLVRFDGRGTGLSERRLPASLDEALLDLDAVVDRLKLDTFALHANTSAVPSVIRFAARHPERVSRLVIVDGFLRSVDLDEVTPVAALRAAAEADWEIATEAIGAMAFGSGSEEARVHGAFVRECVDPAYLTWRIPDIDVTQEAASLRMPVLVVRHTGARWITDQMTQQLVSTIPDARLVNIQGTWSDDVDGLVRRMAEFVYEGTGRLPATDPPVADRPLASGVRTVLFTDLVGHTEVMRRLGDARGRDLLREHERIIRDAIGRHGGDEIKADGDGFMVSFGSVASAVECAVGIQRAVERHNTTAPDALHVRMGLNAGEPIEERGDLFGEAVILAARIKDRAGAGEILIPEPVRHLLAGKGYAFADRGEFVPKGFDDAVRLFEVRWRD